MCSGHGAEAVGGLRLVWETVVDERGVGGKGRRSHGAVMGAGAGAGALGTVGTLGTLGALGALGAVRSLAQGLSKGHIDFQVVSGGRRPALMGAPHGSGRGRGRAWSIVFGLSRSHFGDLYNMSR